MRTAVRRTPSALFLTALAMGGVAGCRPEAERSALAQVPTHDIERSAELPAGAAGVTTRRLWTSDYRTFEFSSVSPSSASRAPRIFE